MVTFATFTHVMSTLCCPWTTCVSGLCTWWVGGYCFDCTNRQVV